jgi:hypothetical protein
MQIGSYCVASYALEIAVLAKLALVYSGKNRNVARILDVLEKQTHRGQEQGDALLAIERSSAVPRLVGLKAGVAAIATRKTLPWRNVVRLS